MKVKLLGVIVPAFALVVSAAAFAYTKDQAAEGQKLYSAHCAACHGSDAHGGVVPEQFGALAGRKAPPLAGPGALPGMKNVGQVYQFAKTKMPANKPGSLKNEQYLDIVAFALQANGIQPDNQALTPESAKKIKLTGGKK